MSNNGPASRTRRYSARKGSARLAPAQPRFSKSRKLSQASCDFCSLALGKFAEFAEFGGGASDCSSSRGASRAEAPREASGNSVFWGVLATVAAVATFDPVGVEKSQESQLSQRVLLNFHFQGTKREVPYSTLPHDEPRLADRLPFNLCGGSRLNEPAVHFEESNRFFRCIGVAD